MFKGGQGLLFFNRKSLWGDRVGTRKEGVEEVGERRHEAPGREGADCIRTCGSQEYGRKYGSKARGRARRGAPSKYSIKSGASKERPVLR